MTGSMFLSILVLMGGFAFGQQRGAVEQQYAALCAGCHGETATGTDRGPGLINNRALRRRGEAQIRRVIREGTAGGMPGFPLPEAQMAPLAAYVHAMNASAYDSKPAGDMAAGKAFFFGKGQCATCHMVRGRGGVYGLLLQPLVPYDRR